MLDLTRHPRPPPAPPAGADDPARRLPARRALAPDRLGARAAALGRVRGPLSYYVALRSRHGRCRRLRGRASWRLPAPRTARAWPPPDERAVGWVTFQGKLARERVATWCWWECGVGWGQLPAPPTPATYQALPVPAAPLQIPRSPQRPSPLRFALLLLAPLPPSSPRSRPQLPLHPYQPWHHQDPRVPYLWRIDMIPTSPTIPLVASTQV